MILKHLVDINVNIEDYDQTQYEIIFISAYPLCSVIAPLIGMLSLFSCKSKFYNHQTYWNSLSLFSNTLIYLLFRIFHQEKQEFIEVVAYCLLFVKICISQLIPLQIAYFNNPKYQRNKEYLRQNFRSVMRRKSTPGDLGDISRNNSDHDSQEGDRDNQ